MLRRALAVVLALVALPVWAATGTHAPNVAVQYFNNSGDVCNGCLLFTYSPGTTTKKATYTEVSLTTANANPIVLDSAGRATIFLTPGESYKFVLAPSDDTDPPASAIWSRDNISAIAPTNSATDTDITGTAGENLAAGDAVYLSDGSGGTTGGRWYAADADNTYSSTTAQALGFATTSISTGSSGAIRISGRITGLSGLVAGTTYYVSATGGALTSSAPTNARSIAVADSTTSAVISPFVGTNQATTTVPGAAKVQAYVLRNTTDTTQAANVGSGEDNLRTATIAANTLDADGEALRITVWGTYAANANNKTIKVYLGSTAFADSGALGINSGGWVYQVLIVRTGAATQKATGWIITDVTDTIDVSTTTGTEDLTTALTLKTTGEATNDNDIVQQGMIVEVLG